MAENTIPPLREYELFLKVLARHVYAANLRDSTDFRLWLLECAEQVSKSATLQEFFNKLPL